MAQAQGSLSSAVHAVEGVPLPLAGSNSHHGDSNKIETGRENPLSICSSIAAPHSLRGIGANADASLSPKDNFVDDPGASALLLPSSAPRGVSVSPIGTPSFQNKYALKFLVRGGKAYLADYSDSGILFGDFAYAKLFSSLETARNLSNVFSCELVRVFICPDGTAKLALQNCAVNPLIERRRADIGASNNQAPDTKAGARAVESNPALNEDGAGAAGAVAIDNPPSFLPRTPIPSDAKQLFLQFVSRYLGVTVFAIQAGYKNTPDTYLFQGPHGTSMNIPTSVMLLDQASALAIIKEKLSEKQKAFGMGAA